MSVLATWVPQLILVCIPLATGILAFQTARRHPAPASDANAATAPARTTLNGSYTIIRTCLERLQALQVAYDEERTRAIRLEARLDECQKRHAARAAHARTTTPKPAPPEKPAPSTPPAAPAPRMPRGKRSRATR